MTDRVSTADLKKMFAQAARCLREQHPYLTQLDSVAGDGDHGIAMLRTAEQVEAAAQDECTQSPQALLTECGWRVLSVDGGASTALLGAFLTGMADAAGQCDLDCEALAAIFESGLNAVLKQTRARPGDKTMVDAVAPAVAAIRSAAASGAPVAAALKQAAAAARAGAESTKTLVARYGRAKFQGDKTLGHADAGAASMALLFHGFSLAFTAQQEMDHGGY